MNAETFRTLVLLICGLSTVAFWVWLLAQTL